QARKCVERRGGVLVEDELGGEADDPAGAEGEECALADIEPACGHQRGYAPAGSAAVIPDLAADDVRGPLVAKGSGYGGGHLWPWLRGAAHQFKVEQALRSPHAIDGVEQEGQRSFLSFRNQCGKAGAVADQAGGRVEHGAADDLAEAVVLEG